MKWLLFMTLTLLSVACELSGECWNTSKYQILAMKDGQVFQQNEAMILCTSWTSECSSKEKEVLKNCKCTNYQLKAPMFAIDFPRLEEGDSVKINGGSLTVTRKRTASTECEQGNNYVDYAGVFEGTIQGHTYRRGVFYAPGEP